MNSTASIASGNDQNLISHPVVRWGLILIGLAGGCLLMDITVRRPMLRELTAVRHELSYVESQLQSLVGGSKHVWQANDLLSALRSQQRSVEQARAALASIRDFRRQVEFEAQKTADAAAVLDQILQSQSRLRETQRDTEQTEVAIQKLTDLQTKILENSVGVEAAQRNAADLIAVKNTVQSAGDAEAARQTAQQLIALRDTVQLGADQTGPAISQAEKLVTLRDSLASSTEDIQLAEQNWESMRKLEGDMLAAGKGITDAIETLELLTDLSDEMRMQSQVVVSVRRSLMDFAALETTVGRVMRVLEPLAQLKNLSRLSDAEVRSAARAILDQRTKLTRRDVPTGETHYSPPALDVDEFEVNELDSAPTRLVPTPMDPELEPGPSAPMRSEVEAP